MHWSEGGAWEDVRRRALLHYNVMLTVPVRALSTPVEE
jgi:hypothetical protein